MDAINAENSAAARESLANAIQTTLPQVLPHPDDAFGRLLLRWQDDRDQKAFEDLVASSRSLVTSVARRTLRGASLDPGSLIDDLVSLILDHLRRLPAQHHTGANTPTPERTVRPFQPDPRKPNAGRRYLVWLTQRRAKDIARRERRDQRRCRCYTASDPHQVRVAIMQASSDQQAAARSQALQDDCLAWIQEMLAFYDPADRLLMEMVLEGKTLGAIAHVLDCSKGTASRRRQRIEQSLREAVQTDTHTTAFMTTRG